MRGEYIMVKDLKKQKEETYEINNKKYKVITKCIENSQSIDKMYSILCEVAISKLAN